MHLRFLTTPTIHVCVCLCVSVCVCHNQPKPEPYNKYRQRRSQRTQPEWQDSMAPALARQGRGPRRAPARRVHAARRWGGSLTRSPHTARAKRAGAHGTRHTHGTHTHTHGARAHTHRHTRVARTKETGTQVLRTSQTHTLEKGALGLSSPGVHLMSVCTPRASAAHNGASGPLHTGTRTQRGRGWHWW